MDVALDDLVIRSVTGFCNTYLEWSSSGVKNAVLEAIESIESVTKTLETAGLSVWTKRISLPIPRIDLYRKIPGLLSEAITKKDYLLSAGCYMIEEIDYDTLLNLVELGAYVCLAYSDEEVAVNKLTKYLIKLSSIDPIYTTQVALSLNGLPVETPYFPISTSLYGKRIGVSLLYPNYLAKAYSEGGLEGVKKALLRVERELSNLLKGVNIFIDYSISPWRDESVARLIELVTNAKPYLNGFLYGIHALNKAIAEASLILRKMGGFNKVMLPYAEDSYLIELGGRGLINARDFIRYSSASVPGVDMVVVPLDEYGVKGLILDALAVAYLKNYPTGLRVIPVDNEPGSIVKLGRFGEVYVLNY
ncbi:MAG: DUF711 family protein [Sulfolobales archaeon]|nr:DUF711 family protein [Sulfolobales archaeon]MCX8199187.1 DUF711 family protein [Sulfolobales archaeon]MDW8170167.1 DUF711 family protein [Desulfurococcaceae archaeon]